MSRSDVECLNFESILPKTSYSGYPLLLRAFDDKLLVEFRTKYSNGKEKTERFQPRSALLPRNIPLSNELIEMLGAYQGDGQTSTDSKSYQAVRFVNSSPTLVKKFLDFMRIFEIIPSDVDAEVIASTALREQESENSLLAYWTSVTQIPAENFYKCRWNPSKYAHSRCVPHGTLALIYGNSSFRLAFDSLFNEVKKRALHDGRIAAAFLRGWIAADGCFYHSGAIRQLILAAKDSEDRAYARQLFEKLEITPSKDALRVGKEAVNITGYTNMEKIAHFNLCQLHPDKQLKFNKAFRTYRGPSYRKGEGAYKIKDLLAMQPKTIAQLASLLERKPNAVRAHLYALEKDGFVSHKQTIKTARTGRHAERWQLTNPAA
jgi:hypothetical protein